MNVYQFTLEIQDGVNSYEQKELVLAPNDRTAAEFAQAFARHWRANARYDSKLDVYTAPEGFPQWILAQCKPITHFDVPVAGKRHCAHIALIPWQVSFADMLALAAEFFRAVCDPTLADCSVRWIVTDHLHLGERRIANAFKASLELRDNIPANPTLMQVESETSQ